MKTVNKKRMIIFLLAVKWQRLISSGRQKRVSSHLQGWNGMIKLV